MASVESSSADLVVEVGDPPLRVDEQGQRESRCGQGRFSSSPSRSKTAGKRTPEVLRQASQRCPAVPGDHAEHEQPVTDGVGEALELRQLLPARRALGRPQVDHSGPAERGEPDHPVPAEARQHQVGDALGLSNWVRRDGRGRGDRGAGPGQAANGSGPTVFAGVQPVGRDGGVTATPEHSTCASPARRP